MAAACLRPNARESDLRPSVSLRTRAHKKSWRVNTWFLQTADTSEQGSQRVQLEGTCMLWPERCRDGSSRGRSSILVRPARRSQQGQVLSLEVQHRPTGAGFEHRLDRTKDSSIHLAERILSRERGCGCGGLYVALTPRLPAEGKLQSV